MRWRARTVWLLVAFALLILSALGTYTFQLKDFKRTTVNGNIRNLSCLTTLGSSGRWIQDWEYAASAQYETFPPNITKITSQVDWKHKRDKFAQQRFIPTADAPFRWATTWRWVDDFCPIRLVSLEGFCQLSKDLGLKYVHSIGDSMTSTFSTSFLSLLNHVNMTDLFWNKTIPISCPDHPNLYFRHSRVNLFIDVDNVSIPFVDHRNVGRAVHIINVGAHVGSLQEFKGNFTAIQNWILKLNRTQDIFFRSTIPGHPDCPKRPKGIYLKRSAAPLKVVPHSNWSEWHNLSRTLPYQWSQFEHYNRYAQENAFPPLYYLNVFNSTVLRRDGHTLGGDCLHYFVPGPTDWWVHFLFTSLLQLR